MAGRNSFSDDLCSEVSRYAANFSQVIALGTQGALALVNFVFQSVVSKTKNKSRTRYQPFNALQLHIGKSGEVSIHFIV